MSRYGWGWTYSFQRCFKLMKHPHSFFSVFGDSISYLTVITFSFPFFSSFFL